MQHDDFYDKLPFTLTPEQTSPEYVIFGTGLQECLIAAYKSKSQGKTGLIIDVEKTYGSSLKTVTLKEFHQLTIGKAQERMYDFLGEGEGGRNGSYMEWCLANNKYRGFSIDIEPNFFYAASVTCQCLKDADMDKYMDFHLVTNILHLHNGSFNPVPLSKGRIFESKELSLLEKKTLLMSLHKLIKIYHRFKQLPEDPNSTKQFDKGFGEVEEELYSEFEHQLDQSFRPFLQRLVKSNRKIMHYLTYIICNYQYNYERPLPPFATSLYTLRGFIEKFGKFIRSCGVYGESPYLYVDNGIGDIPQAFSRIASIYGSTYILHPKITIDRIEKHQENIKIHTNLSPDCPITTKQVYFGPTYLHLSPAEELYHQEVTLRVLVLCEKSGKEESCPSICFINEAPGFDNPVYLFAFDNSTQSCPSALIIYQFETILTSKEGAQQKGKELLELLAGVRGEGFRESVKYFSPYLRTRRYPIQAAVSSANQWRLHDTKGIDLDQHFTNFIDIVGEHPHYFKKEDQPEEQQQPYGGYQTNYLLQKLNEISLNEEPAPPKEKNKIEDANIKKQEEKIEEKPEDNCHTEPSQPEQPTNQAKIDAIPAKIEKKTQIKPQEEPAVEQTHQTQIIPVPPTQVHSSHQNQPNQ